MKTINDGGAAFPMLGNVAHNSDWLIDYGMSLRDYFAGQALVGEIISVGNDTLSILPGGTVDEALARDAKRRAEWCYRQADAMLKAREVKP